MTRMKRPAEIIKCCCVTLLFPLALNSQDLEKIGRKDMVTVNGGMNFNSVFYDAQGFVPRRDPFTWYFNGNLTVNFLDVSLPFTFSYSNLHGTFTQPFNMQSCSPKYKWAQAHLGTTAMSFSAYTLAGHVFTGGGIELTPNGFYFGGMYGRLKKAVEYDAAAQSFDAVSFKRMGGAVKFGYDKNGHAFCATYFTAKDETESLSFIPPGADLPPQQNTAISLSGKTRLFDLFTAEGEIALSGLTRNILAGSETTDFGGFEKWLLPTKTTTQFFRAWKAAIGYAGKHASVKVAHEHVDPDYQTFGAYYFNNDLQSWTVAPSFRLFRGKLSVALNTGIQRNNLDASKLNTMHRWVGSANISFTPAAAWMFSGAYSNFTSYTNRRPQTDPFWQPSPADTLSFYQVAQQANFSLVHTSGTKTLKQTLSLIGSYQVTGQQQSGVTQPGVEILNGNFSWAAQFTRTKTAIAFLTNYNRAMQQDQTTELLGPGIQCTQALLKNALRISAGSVYNRSLAAGLLTGHVLSHRAQLGWSPKVENKKLGKPAMSLVAVYVNRFAASPSETGTNELTVTVNVGVNF